MTIEDLPVKNKGGETQKYSKAYTKPSLYKGIINPLDKSLEERHKAAKTVGSTQLSHKDNISIAVQIEMS